MRSPILLLSVCFATACVGFTGPPVTRSRANCAWDVCVDHIDYGSGRTYIAVNEEPVPATVGLSFRTWENLEVPDRDLITVVPPDTTVTLTRLERVDRRRPVAAAISISIDLGSSTTPYDPDYLYAVPFGGRQPREVIQSFAGKQTHMASMRYALDFAMPQGTPVLAARAGTVLLVQDGFTEGGTDPELLERANLVVVAHEDGTMASYGHLRKGVSVVRGQEVEEGEVLGWSGATGFAGQPHLHFHVGTLLLGEPGRTIPFRLKDQDGHPLDVSRGATIPPARMER